MNEGSRKKTTVSNKKLTWNPMGSPFLLSPIGTLVEGRPKAETIPPNDIAKVLSKA